MVGKHYKWQTHWTVNGRTATHDSGLVVNYPLDGEPVATAGGLDIVLPTIDAANREARLQRLLREAREIVESSNNQ